MSEKFIRTYRYYCVAIFCLIALGGAVRAMNAGLSCPDWPLCFGEIIPDYHPQVYFEFIHRVIAGLISIAAVILNYKIIRTSSVKKSTRIVAGASLALLILQIVMGGLTVLLQLQNKIVALHLAMGTGFFALSFWVYLSLSYQEKFPGSADSSRAKLASKILLACVYGQMLLGALVASNYAALVCTDFPLCQGEFIPTLSGIIGLHVIHRLGAYTLTVVVLSFFVFIYKKVKCPEIRRWSLVALIILLIQVGIGISNVVFFTPPIITVLHLATGVLLFSVAIRLVRISTFKS